MNQNNSKDRPLSSVESAACRLLCAMLALFLLYLGLCPLAGCASVKLPPPETYDFVTNALQLGASIWRETHAGPAEGSDSGNGASSESAGPASSSSSSVCLDFRFGGFNGVKAKEDPRCRLSSPKITADTIRYKWETKAPSDWARSKSEKGDLVIAAAFYWDDGAKKWVGGKFEWTDESRSSRSCQNIYEGYGGWEAAAWEYAKKRAFCVLSADGKYRSNLLED